MPERLLHYDRITVDREASERPRDRKRNLLARAAPTHRSLHRIGQKLPRLSKAFVALCTKQFLCR